MRIVTHPLDVATAMTDRRTFADMLRALASALVVPLLVTLLTAAPFAVAPALDGDDRALLWIAGDAAARDAAAAAVADHPVFPGGATREGAAPAGCPADALRLHLDIARTDEAHVAGAVLGQLARDAGATVCGDTAFEVARAGTLAAWTPLALSIVVPAALLFAVRGARSPAVPGPGERHEAATVAPSLPAALAACAAIAVVVMPLPGGIAPTGPLLPAGFALATMPPAIHEAAFRGWLLSRAVRVMPASAAALLSIGASAAAAAAVAPDVPLPATLAIAAVTSVVYLRSRSLPTCIAVHVLAAALWRGFAG